MLMRVESSLMTLQISRTDLKTSDKKCFPSGIQPLIKLKLHPSSYSYNNNICGSYTYGVSISIYLYTNLYTYIYTYLCYLYGKVAV